MIRRRALLKSTTLGLCGGVWGWSINAQAQTTGGPTKAHAKAYAMPLESEPHKRTFMQWPSNPRVYGGMRWLRQTQSAVARIANAVAAFEPVVMLASVREREKLRNALSREVEHWEVPTDDLWCRDSGPTFVRSAAGELAVLDLNFNGWGNKQTHRHDASVAARVAELMQLPLIDSGVVGEGGGIETDGSGTLLAHESSWVIENRNPGLSRAEVEQRLLAGFGGRAMIWAPGIKGRDITDYHIDALARFVEPGRVLIELPENYDADDPWCVAAYETRDVLAQAVDANGRRLEITTIRPPQQVRSSSPDFLGSYANYYVCNGAVIAPEFGDAEGDAASQETFAALYPGREIVTVDIDPVAEAGGGIHCATQQQPAGEVS